VSISDNDSSLPLWSFDHSAHITLCACLDALVPSCYHMRLTMSINTAISLSRGVYQASLMTRRTPKHACMSADWCIKKLYGSKMSTKLKIVQNI
jgi:hypothetical protein